jgi:hypothetical protein
MKISETFYLQKAELTQETPAAWFALVAGIIHGCTACRRFAASARLTTGTMVPVFV